jgi:hypothetical protein
VTRLDALLRPGEAVRFGASRPAIWPGYVIFAVVVVLALPVVTLGIAAAAGAIRPLPFLLTAGIAGGVLLIVLPAWLADRAGSGLVVTDRRMIWRRGLLRRRVLSLDRTEIRSAEAYAGSGVLRLHLADGSMRRIPWIDVPDSVARTLGCAARIWSAVPEPDVPRTVRLLGAATVLLPYILYEMALVFDMAVGLDETTQKAVLWGIMLVLAFFGSHLSNQAMHIFAARLMTPEALRTFACWHLDPLCRGREPRPEEGGPWWVRLDRAYARLIARRFYGGRLDCACEPEKTGTGSFG